MCREKTAFTDADTPPARVFSNEAVLGHELAHQWFGNLVTPEWWAELWLKEAFADYLGVLAMDTVRISTMWGYWLWTR